MPGDLNARRSAVGKVAFLGSHVVKHSSNFLQVIGLSSAENEYHAMSVGASTGLGLQSLLRHWVVHAAVHMESDSSGVGWAR